MNDFEIVRRAHCEYMHTNIPTCARAKAYTNQIDQQQQTFIYQYNLTAPTRDTDARSPTEALLVGFLVGLKIHFILQDNATASFCQAYWRRFECDAIRLTRILFALIFAWLSRVGLYARMAGFNHKEVLERNRVRHNHIFGLGVGITACVG